MISRLLYGSDLDAMEASKYTTRQAIPQVTEQKHSEIKLKSSKIMDD
jgi:hypothetical protein